MKIQFCKLLTLVTLLRAGQAFGAGEIDAGAGALGKFEKVPLRGGGGFELVDFATHTPVALTNGEVEKLGEVTKFHASGDGIELVATFSPTKDGIQISGEIRNTAGGGRAILLRYVVPVPVEGAEFQDEPGRSTKLGGGASAMGTVYPQGAITGPGWGVGVAIPPSYPCCFGIGGSDRGLSLELYLGITETTKNFPNSARFEFLIVSALPGWGFRSVLADYYRRYPQFYTPKFQGSGFWNWQEKGEIDHALGLFRFQGIPRGKTFFQDLERNKKLGLLTFDYVIVGQREIRNLPELPQDGEAAAGELARLASRWKADPAAVAKEYPHWRDRDLPLLIERCAVTTATGDFRIRPRETVWGKNSLTFTMNPNPELFRDKGWDTVGSTTLDTISGWYEKDPIDGIMIDSLGNQWPSTLNYRKDHFPYAAYPLTFDGEGRIALHNRTSHYEFVAALRKLSDEHGRFLFANGICRYESAAGEHHNSRENGRFFMASLLDAAGREITADLDRPLLEFFRASMGRKLFSALLYKWDDPEVVRRQMNRALVYDVFAGPLRCFLDDVSYLKSPDGYFRDKPLLEWFVEKARFLHDAGWQPVTFARAKSPDTAIERYGDGEKVYFALSNFGDVPVDEEISIDVKALGLSGARVSEVGRGSKIESVGGKGNELVKIQLAPDEACILQLTR